MANKITGEEVDEDEGGFDRGVDGTPFGIRRSTAHFTPPKNVTEVPYEWLLNKLSLHQSWMREDKKESTIVTLNPWEIHNLIQAVAHERERVHEASTNSQRKRRKPQEDNSSND